MYQDRTSSPSTLTPRRHRVVEEARGWLQVRWLHQGRTRHGIDCAGLVVMVARALGLSEYDATNYQRRTTGTLFLKHFSDNMDRKPVQNATPGDVLLFRDGAYPCHASIVAERDGALTIVHAHAPRRKVIEEELDQGDWKSKRIACFSFRGIDD